MKKILLFALLFSLNSALYAHPLIEAKAGYFFFLDSKMDQIYKSRGLDLQLSASYPLKKELHLYASIEWFEKSGRSLNAHEKTTLWALPLSLGFRPMIPVSKQINYYLTLGPRYFFVYVHNDSPFIDRHMDSNGCGIFANTGFLFNLNRHLTVDLFAEYSYAKLSFKASMPGVFGEDAQVGGLTFGGGLAYRF